MAPQLSDLETLAKLLALKARRGRLTNAQLISLVDTCEAIGEPEELIEILNGYLEHYPDHREAWLALARVPCAGRCTAWKSALLLQQAKGCARASGAHSTAARAYTSLAEVPPTA